MRMKKIRLLILNGLSQSELDLADVEEQILKIPKETNWTGDVTPA